MCGAVGSWQMWGYSIPPGWAATFQELVAFAILMVAFGYFLAAFLLARRSLPWRIAGGVLDGGLSVMVVFVLVRLGYSEMLYAEYAPANDPYARPFAIAFAIAVLWILALTPVVAMAMTFVMKRIGADRHGPKRRADVTQG